MIYPVLGVAEGEEVLAAMKTSNPLPVYEATWVGTGVELDPEVAEDMIDGLHELRRKLGEPSEGGKRYWAQFEGKASQVVHETLALDASTAADPEFWIWLVFGRDDDRLVRFVDWRHSAPGLGLSHPANYGLSHLLAEGLFSRLWLRGDIGFEPGSTTPYELSWRGDQDLWRSHILRQEFAYARQMARALVRFQYPDSDPDKPRVSVEAIREIVKGLRRKNAALAFELLSEEEAMELIFEVRDSL